MARRDADDRTGDLRGGGLDGVLEFFGRATRR